MSTTVVEARPSIPRPPEALLPARPRLTAGGTPPSPGGHHVPRINVGDFADDRFDQPDGRSRAAHQKAPPGERLGRHRRRPGRASHGDPQHLPGIPRQPGPAAGAGVARHVVSRPGSPSEASIKTGKEADVELIERVDPQTGCVVPAGRQALSLEPSPAVPPRRRLPRGSPGPPQPGEPGDGDAHRRSAGRSSPGSGPPPSSRSLGTLWSAGVAVPYPVQIGDTELLMEFIGDPDGTAAPRLAELRPDLRRRSTTCGCSAGRRSSRSPPAASPMVTCRRTTSSSTTADSCSSTSRRSSTSSATRKGAAYLRRDCDNICRWFTANGHPDADAGELSATLASEAGIS